MTAANVPLQPTLPARLQARRGLGIYFAIVLVLSAVFQAIIISTGDLSWVFALM